MFYCTANLQTGNIWGKQFWEWLSKTQYTAEPIAVSFIENFHPEQQWNPTMDMHLFLLEFEKERLWHFSKKKQTLQEVLLLYIGWKGFKRSDCGIPVKINILGRKFLLKFITITLFLKENNCCKKNEHVRLFKKRNQVNICWTVSENKQIWWK